MSVTGMNTPSSVNGLTGNDMVMGAVNSGTDALFATAA
ncbi:MAG: hypothetical protein JWN48_5152 [Myxococcaceae bacterium]|nr:hypothetical protein [Myxococcaceae bacterium]